MFSGIPVMLMTNPSGRGFQGIPVSVVNASEVGMQPDDFQATAPMQVADNGDGTITFSLVTDVANGVPVLDGSGLIKLAQMPISGLNYHGNWNASTNTPTLADGAGTAGDFYRVSVAGTQDLGSGTLNFAVGDHVIYEGGTWQQFTPPSQTAWGGIIGTLADQTDLQAALDAKLTTPTLTTKVVLGTSLEQNTIGLVGYDQDVLGDMLVMRRFSGAVATADATQTDEAVTLAQLNTAIAGVGTQSDLGTPQSHNTTDVFLTASSPTVQLISTAIGDVLVHLPEASAVSAGKRYIIKRLTAAGSGLDITVDDNNGALIDGTSSIGIADQYSVREVVFDGTNWQIIGTSGS